jgi:hypothetical protein
MAQRETNSWSWIAKRNTNSQHTGLPIWRLDGVSDFLKGAAVTALLSVASSSIALAFRSSPLGVPSGLFSLRFTTSADSL